MEPIINTHDREILARRFTRREMKRIKVFFTPFHPTARIYLAYLFFQAKIRGRTLKQVLVPCRKQWEEVWIHGTGGRLGDPDDTTPPNIGFRNTAAFFTIYKYLSIPFPKTLGS
jgi:hypothetical protein